VENPKNVSVIILRFGKKIEVPTLEPIPKKEVHPTTSKRKCDEQVVGPSTSSAHNNHQSPILIPFPPKAIPSKHMEEVDKEILDIFRKVEVKIPLLDAIKKI